MIDVYVNRANGEQVWVKKAKANVTVGEIRQTVADILRKKAGKKSEVFHEPTESFLLVGNDPDNPEQFAEPLNLKTEFCEYILILFLRFYFLIVHSAIMYRS